MNNINIRKTKLYNVIIFSDESIPILFVEKIINIIFNKNEEEANSLAKLIFDNGSAVVGTYSKEIAETKLSQTLYNAEKNNFPLEFALEELEE